LLPDLTIYLDLAAEEGLQRKWRARQAQRAPGGTGEGSHARHGEGDMAPGSTSPGQLEWNRLDARDLAYHKRVEAGFRELMLRNPERWCRLDAHLPVEELAQAVAQAVEPLLERVQPLEQG
jgi:dTMP kinase